MDDSDEYQNANGEDEVQAGLEGGGAEPVNDNASAPDEADTAEAQDSDSGSEDIDEEEQYFDIALAASHSYMGPRLVAVDGEREAIGPGWEGRLSVMAHHGTVFPGETVPMLLTEGDDAEIMSQSIQADKRFGLMCPDETGLMVSGYGVVCEVYELEVDQDSEDEGHQHVPWTPVYSYKARATHRFRCNQMPKLAQPIQDFDRMRIMEVRVLAEVYPGDPLQHVRLDSLNPLRGDHSLRARLARGVDATVTPWPLFVYDLFDFRRMRQIIKDYFKTLALENVPEEAVELSFWTASNLAVSARDRLALFMVDDALLRLHMEVKLIARKSVLCCGSCTIEIARREDIFPMSTEGVHSNYTNLGGFMHDIITVSHAYNTAPSGRPSDEYSWFPGYTWTIMLCQACLAHVGWRFDAQRRNLRPLQFYGLCRNYLQPRNDGDTQPTPTSRDSPDSPDSSESEPLRTQAAALRVVDALRALAYGLPREAL